jgi:hypothetical protein
MPGHGEKYGRKVAQLIAAMLEQPTYEAAAAKVGVCVDTVYKWIKRPDFKERFREARKQVVDLAVTRLCGLTNEAVETLKRNLQCGHYGSEIRSALGVLENVRGLLGVEEMTLEIERLQGRIAELEQRASAPAHTTNGRTSVLRN